ncbi:MAG: glycogen/starch/alpha-glucan family phosphorylase [Atopobiaceae bacterium]|nr:glycogen/starch/alpha-glucan family phosphorylase [Atopobiaceae bacterium]
MGLDLNSVSLQRFQRPLAEISDSQVYELLLCVVQNEAKELPLNSGKKRLYYISAEFLIGKLLTNNLINLGLYEKVKEQLATAGHNLDAIEEFEVEPSLGNGGLGRLAACFIDSMSTLGLPGDGVGLNYHYGLFHQKFLDEQQTTVPDPWLAKEKWLADENTSFTVEFSDFSVTSQLYSIDVLGYERKKKNKLHLFDLQTVDDSLISDDSIAFDKTALQKNLTLFLYPDDSDVNGQLLRVYQQYFMVSNAAQLIVKEAIERGSNVHDLADYVVIQINDTHPTMVIPELIRILTETYGISFEESVSIVSSLVAYTNHTILAEALEKWPLEFIEKVSHKIAGIIRRLDDQIRKTVSNPDVQIIIDGKVHMAHLAIHYGFSINGVAALHTKILEETELKPFYDLYPEKFSNKTNGITFRRWLMECNPDLAQYLDELLGKEWRKTGDLTGLMAYVNDDNVLYKLENIKQAAKSRMKKFLERNQSVLVRDNSIIDVQVKRFHEYKRQQMLLLYLIWKYFDIKAGNVPQHRITVIFGGKAAPAYIAAQDIIHAILTFSSYIAKDPEVAPYLQVVMIENYNVTAAEYVIPAADISEQISLASKEASGTSNMKFMLNGAVTLCTVDGANVEIADLVGKDNIYTFGASSDEVVAIYKNDSYNAHEYYMRPIIKPLVDFLISSQLIEMGNEKRLNRLHDNLCSQDSFMTLLDLEAYITEKERVYTDYENRRAWLQKSLVNIAMAGKFSSDRTISEYNNEIWHLTPDE